MGRIIQYRLLQSENQTATIDVTAAEHNVDIDTSELNRAFCAYAMKNFGRIIYMDTSAVRHRAGISLA